MRFSHTNDSSFLREGEASGLRKNVLGKTQLTVSCLGFGGIPIQRVSEEEAIRVVRHSYERGITYFDTARNYTVSEERIGKALNDVRDKVVLATKSSNRTKKGVLEDLDVSLNNLRTDWIDVYQLHNVSSKEVWDQVTAPNGGLKALYQAQREGKIHHLGVTSHDPTLLVEIVNRNVFETIMIPYNYLTPIPAHVLLPLCHRMNVGTIIMKPFGGGVFSNAQIALKFLLENQDVDVIIPGMMSRAEVEENVMVASASSTLQQEELKLIKQDRLALGDQFCRACNYCQPCPQDIPISTVLRWEVTVKRMGWAPRIIDRLKDGLAKAATCIECGDCESRCPYHLPIRELLPRKAASLQEGLVSEALS